MIAKMLSYIYNKKQGLKMAFEIDFYEKENGKSEILDFIDELRNKKENDKNARIQYKQIILYIELLSKNGTALPQNITKHLEDDIWELRPGNNRVLYFFIDKNNTYVLLHHFRKTTQKTPKQEIEKAKKERIDYLKRKVEKK